MKAIPANLLQPGESFCSWRHQEESLWLMNIRISFASLMIVGSSVRLLLSIVQFTSWSYVAMMGVSLVLALGMFVKRPERSWVQKLQTLAFQVVAQSYSIFMVLNVHTNNYSFWCVCSTLFFCVYEMASFREWWVVLLMFCRHLVLWKYVAIRLEQEHFSTSLPFFLLSGSLMLVLYCVKHRRKQAIERFELFDSLEQQHSKLMQILQAIPEGLAVVLETCEVPCFNSHLALALGSDSIRTCLEQVHCGDSPDCLMLEVQRFIDGDLQTATLGVTSAGDKYYEWKSTKCVWDKRNACILTASDITSWVEAKAKLQKESDSKTSLLRFVSHELRTPTNAILNLVSTTMSAANLTTEQKTDLSIVITSTHFLLSVINDLLDFSRIIADRFSLVKQHFDVRKELTETVQLIELQCAQKNLFLKTKIDSLVPETIYSDPNRVKQVLLNLLSNALKFTFAGGIRVICMMTDYGFLKISVKDTGVGIPEHRIAGLCTAFNMIEDTQRINPQGCGLGLYISNLLVQSLGFKPISIMSKVGVGSEFSFEISISSSDNRGLEGVTDITTEGIDDEREFEQPIVFDEMTGGMGQARSSLPQVLVVDDSDFNRLVLVRLLATFNLRAHTASTGLRALSLIRENLQRGHCYQLILLDVEMPEMDGVTAAQEIRAMQASGEMAQGLLIFACSAHHGREDYDRCIRAGMDGYLEKPVSKSKLQELVESLRRIER